MKSSLAPTRIQKMNRRMPMLLLLCAPLAFACQQLDSSASSENPQPDFGNVPDPGNGTIPDQTETPPILLDDGTTTTDPCVKVTQDADKIRQNHCAGCHQAATPGAQTIGAPLTFIMNDAMLSNTPTPTTNSDWVAAGLMDYVKPGDPEHSLIYWRAAIQGDMPKPAQDPSQISYPPTTLSEDSILHEWILHCMPPTSSASTGN